MTIYVGFGRWSDGYLRDVGEKLRSGKTAAQANEELGLTAKAQAFNQSVPQGLRIIGSYAPQGIGGAHPSFAESPLVRIIETDDPAHVTWATNYYAGYLNVAYHPYTQAAQT